MVNYDSVHNEFTFFCVSRLMISSQFLSVFTGQVFYICILVDFLSNFFATLKRISIFHGVLVSLIIFFWNLKENLAINFQLIWIQGA